ncbi:hypothetical protein Cni_G16314 [Canna indica]|uniref:Uncharacterized protein n=1 Tax=Canna indica TaxID=4628 RepID=A0AAQ3KF43_9LILI|nr:hypothetical protein Cni_G16314 [Canna indica]
MAGSPVPGVALRQVDVSRQRRAARVLQLPHRLRQARRAVGGVQVAEALHVPLHRAGAAHPEAYRVLQISQHVVPPPEELAVVARARAALAVHHRGVRLPQEVLVAVPHEASVELQRRRERVGAHEIELPHCALHAGRAIGGAEVVPALVEPVGGRTVAVAGAVTVVGSLCSAGDDGGEERVEIVLERGVSVILRWRAAGVDEGGGSGQLLGVVREEKVQ